MLGPVTTRWISGGPERRQQPARARGAGPDPARPLPAGRRELEWCDRRLLARIHRYTLNRLRAEIEPVTAADFLRFLLHWQHVAGEDQVRAPKGSPRWWSSSRASSSPRRHGKTMCLPARVADYDGRADRQLCLSGRAAWGRLTPGRQGAAKSSPIALMLREHARIWGARESRFRSLRGAAVREALRNGAHRSFTRSSRRPACCRLSSSARWPSSRARASPPPTASRPARAARAAGKAPEARSKRRDAGRCWRRRRATTSRPSRARCSSATAWCSARCCARIAASAVARTGAGVSEARGARGDSRRPFRRRLRRRAVRRSRRGGAAARRAQDGKDRRARRAERRRSAQPGRHPDAGARVPAIHGNRILFRDGVAIAAIDGGELRRLADTDLSDENLRTLLARRSLRQPLRPHCVRRARARLASSPRSSTENARRVAAGLQPFLKVLRRQLPNLRHKSLETLLPRFERGLRPPADLANRRVQPH